MTVDKFGHHVTKRQKLDIENVSLRLENFEKEVYEKVTQEVKHYKTINEAIQADVKSLEIKLNTHEKNNEKLKEIPGKFIELETKINELSGKVLAIEKLLKAVTPQNWYDNT